MCSSILFLESKIEILHFGGGQTATGDKNTQVKYNQYFSFWSLAGLLVHWGSQATGPQAKHGHVLSNKMAKKFKNNETPFLTCTHTYTPPIMQSPLNSST